MMKRKIIVALSVIFALSLSVLCFASCTSTNAKKPTYTVTFETDGGSEVAAQQVARGAKVTKPEDPTKTDYNFGGWYLGEEEYDFSTIVRSKLTLTAKWVAVVYYDVTWKNEDGIVLATSKAAAGTTPAYTGETPTKAATAQYTYAFTGWTPAIVAATENAEYTATYSSTVNTYDILWKNEDGTLLYTSEDVPYGTLPEYAGETPMKADTVEHSYVHNGWTPTVEAVTGEATYTATFEETARKYTVTFMNGEEVLTSDKYEYGAMPSYEGTPTKDATAQYTYTFSGWDNELAAVTGDTTYTAQFSETVNKYTVAWLDEDDNALCEPEEYEYGATPTYKGDIPVKAATAQYTYTFSGWTPETTSVTGNATYKLTYNSTVNTYTVTFNSNGGSAVDAQEIEYGSAASEPSDPTKSGYVFIGWQLSGVDYDFSTAVEGDITLTALWEEEISIEASSENIYLSVAGKSATATIDSNVAGTTYTSGDDSIATVSGNTVTAAGNGNVTIIATTPYGQTDSVTIHVFEGISDSTSFDALYSNLSGNYIITADNVTPTVNTFNTPVFTGILDGDGHTITYGARLFREVNGGIIKNLTLKGDHGVWGGAIADVFTSGTVENVIVDVSVGQSRNYGDSTNWFARQAGAMFNFNNGGTIKDSIVIMTIPSNVTDTDGCTVANIHAFYSGGSAAVNSVVNSVAYYKNNATSDALYACSTIPAVNLNVTLDGGDTYQLPAGATSYVSSATGVITVNESGLATAVGGGSATITATFTGYSLTFSFPVYSLISNQAEFIAMYNDLSGYYKLTADIEITNYIELIVSSKNLSLINGTFSGVLDGQGHKIYSAINTERLFTCVSGTVKNLKIDFAIGGWGSVLCYYTDKNALIENVVVNTTITSTDTWNYSDTDWAWQKAKLAGITVINQGTMKNCTVYVTIPADIAENNGWTVSDLSAICTSNSNGASIIDCYAYCINNKDGTISFVNDNQGTISGNSTVSVVAAWPANYPF